MRKGNINLSGYLRICVKLMFVAFLSGSFVFYNPEFSRAQDIPGPVPTMKATFGFYMKVLVETELKDARSAVDYWMKIVGRKVNLEIDGYIYENLDDLRNDFKHGLIDWINISPSDYLQIKDDIEADLGPSPLMGRKTIRRYFLIAQSNSLISEVKDLMGKKLSVTYDNEGGRIFLNTLLWDNNMQGIERHFQELIKKRTFGQAILSVFFGQADACITTDYAFETLVELNPQIRDKLKIVASSPALLHSVSIFRKNLDEIVRRIIENEVYNLDKTVEGQQVLTLFKIDGMVPIQESDLHSFVELYQKYLRLGGDRIKSANIAESKR